MRQSKKERKKKFQPRTLSLLYLNMTSDLLLLSFKKVAIYKYFIEAVVSKYLRKVGGPVNYNESKLRSKKKQILCTFLGFEFKSIWTRQEKRRETFPNKIKTFLHVKIQSIRMRALILFFKKIIHKDKKQMRYTRMKKAQITVSNFLSYYSGIETLEKQKQIIFNFIKRQKHNFNASKVAKCIKLKSFLNYRLDNQNYKYKYANAKKCKRGKDIQIRVKKLTIKKMLYLNLVKEINKTYKEFLYSIKY